MSTNLGGSAGGDAGERARQRRNLLIMAGMFLVLFYSFPAGLVLYWTMSNLGQLGQQWSVDRSLRQQRATAAAG